MAEEHVLRWTIDDQHRYEEVLPLGFETSAAAWNDVGGRFPGGQPRLFQGLWTDPVTGIAYARARWYDPRNASWLSEDPVGEVDSPNLYAFVGWRPQMGRDPLGEKSLRQCRDDLRDEVFDEDKWWLMPVAFLADLGYAVANAASIGTIDRIDHAQEALEAGEIGRGEYWAQVGLGVGRTVATYAGGGIAGKIGSGAAEVVLGRFGTTLVGRVLVAGASGSAGSVGGLLASDVVGVASGLQEEFSSGKDYAFAAGSGFVFGAAIAGGAEVAAKAPRGGAARKLPGEGFSASDPLGEIRPLGRRMRVEFEGVEARAVRDLSHVDESTLRAMHQRGFAAKDIHGNKLELHHLGQDPYGAIVEVPFRRHKLWNTVQHPFGNLPGAGLTAEQRALFNVWRTRYWRARAAQELTRRGLL
jgi:RHS repeat-associated protein